MSRIIRIESLLKQEISRVIHQDFRDNLGLISITHIKIAKDLSLATVYYSHFGDEKEQQRSLEKLNKSCGFIKGMIGKDIRLKRIPNLRFRLDHSLERGFNVVDQLNRLNL